MSKGGARSRERALMPGRRKGVPYSAELAQTICDRVRSGEILYAVLREEGMPTPQTVGVWGRKNKAFGEALSEARVAGGRKAREGGGVWTYCDETAEAVFERLCEGESLTGIGADPAMPCLSTLFYWRYNIPAFEKKVQLACRIRAERFSDRAIELAEAATPETAYLTQVQLTQLRWSAGVMAPRVFRTKPPEPEAPPREINYLIRRFTIETDPETGVKKVVGWCPNPWTGEVEREDRENGWEPPVGTTPMPSG